jgi:hypothetical protein
MAKVLFVGGKTVSTAVLGVDGPRGDVASVHGRVDRDQVAVDDGVVDVVVQLRDGIELDEVRDVLWNYLAIDNYERLVLAQGWPLQRYARWLAGAIAGAVCP